MVWRSYKYIFLRIITDNHVTDKSDANKMPNDSNNLKNNEIDKRLMSV